MSEKSFSRREITALAASVAALAASPAIAAQPNMEKALGHLEAALAALEAAKDNKGGHRVKAIDHVKVAISETRKGISFAS